MIIMTEKTLTVPEKQEMLRRKRSGAEKIYAAFLKKYGEKELMPDAGKGKEPKPWCECHNRNPCPIDKELGLV